MWQRLPIWLRAVLLGLTVSGVPTTVWALLAGLNLRFTPAVPWSAPLMAVVLWLSWRFLNTEGPRREHLRAVPLDAHTWRLALLAGGTAVAAVWAAFAALRGVMHIAVPSADLTRFPWWTIAASVVMGSAVAGVAEEAGFRGYMQLPLERAYGPATALTTTSIIFTLIHLSHGVRILPFLPFYLVVAFVYGGLTLLTRSIFPSMTLHFAGDVLMFTMRVLAVQFGAAGGAETGGIAPIPALAAVVFGVVAIVAFRVLARNGHAIEPTPPVAAVGN